MNLKDFKNLKNLLVYKNNLKSLNITGCTELATVSAVVNDITTFDASTSKKLKKADVKANPLTTVKVYAKSKVRTIKASGNGHFGFEYDNSKKKSITIIAVPDPGYKLKGIYTGSGKKISTKLTTSFAPTVTSYTVKFALDPNSFKYVLRKGNNSSLAPYNLSVQKRLKELGYYKGKLNGKFDSATDTAVKKFQKKNGLKANGFVKEDTWKKLFSTKAKKK